MVEKAPTLSYETAYDKVPVITQMPGTKGNDGMESEKGTEQYLRECIRELGGEAYKFTSPQRRFVLDRLCVLPNGKVWFIEVKSENQEPNEGQYREIIRLIDRGHKACWVKTKAEVNAVI
ncbi:MAG: hypothetical protein M0R68_16005, partial [Bacteroidetes bacterium]|nr:hypothetical protein [Bacteroidota bacterium]